MADESDHGLAAHVWSHAPDQAGRWSRSDGGDEDSGREVPLEAVFAGFTQTQQVTVGRGVAQDQVMTPSRSTKRPEGAPGFSVARPTMASVPSVTVCGPLWPLRSVAV